MEITVKQQLTIQHLKDIQGIDDPLKIIKYCLEKINKPHKGRRRDGKYLSRSETRKYSKKHYEGIINYLAQQRQGV